MEILWRKLQKVDSSSSDRSMVGTFWWLIQWRLEHSQKDLQMQRFQEALTSYGSTYKETIEPYSKEIYLSPASR